MNRRHRWTFGVALVTLALSRPVAAQILYEECAALCGEEGAFRFAIPKMEGDVRPDVALYRGSDAATVKICSYNTQKVTVWKVPGSTQVADKLANLSDGIVFLANGAQIWIANDDLTKEARGCAKILSAP